MSVGAFDWTALPSSTNLVQTPCYDGFQCAKLTVPLQYSDPSAGDAHIAIITSPSTLAHDDPSYRGQLLLNPGGPGEPGAFFVLTWEPYLRAIIGPAYDLVGFDPRGVGHSTPTLSLFADAAEANAYLQTYPSDVGTDSDAFARAYAWSEVYSGIAMQKLEKGEKVWESVGAPAVAMDMLAITRAFGKDEVNYWGWSYGTTIGSTFAAMFPENVGRIALDGVMNAHEYYGGHDQNSLDRTQDALTSIYTSCIAAGPSLCALWSPNVTTIRTRVDALLHSVRSTPLGVAPGPTVPRGGLVDATLLRTSLYQTLYTPYSFSAAFAEALVALEDGDPTPLWTLAASNNSLDVRIALAMNAPTCAAVGDADGAFQLLGGLDTRIPIECGDSAGRARVSRKEARARLEELRAKAGLFADIWWAIFDGPCATWNITAKDRFNGSFTATTKNPMLFVSNTLDPVTPIDSGRNMSSGFTGSVLLEQNSTGHASSSGFSTCTARAVRAFFENGTLPLPGTVCQPDTQIFVDPNNSSAIGGITFPSG